MFRTVLGIIVLALTGNLAVAAEQTHQLLTATEVFNLRSRCAALGDQILEDRGVGSALSQSQVSYYNERTNRCYVEVTAQTANLNVPATYIARYLFDGQTKEMLAFSRIDKGKKVGMVYDRQHISKSLENAGWDDANAYIDKMMADDRR